MVIDFLPYQRTEDRFFGCPPMEGLLSVGSLFSAIIAIVLPIAVAVVVSDETTTAVTVSDETTTAVTVSDETTTAVTVQ